MECKITPRNVGTLCRVCLTSSKTLVHLTTAINEKVKDFQDGGSIHKMLELVTFTKVVLNDKKFPSKICQMCLSFLKMGHDFQTQLKKSQEYLQKVTGETCGRELEEKSTEVPVVENVTSEIKIASAAVELIYGENKFDLNDVLVIEQEEEKKESEKKFDAFLQNLGSIISVTFTNENTKVVKNTNIEHSIELIDTSVISEPQIEETHDLDLSELRVKKYPNESKIVIERVTATSITIIKTLYECSVCKKVVLSEENLETHRKNYHLSEEFVCEKCGHVAYTRSQLYHHAVKHKGKQFICDFCDKKFPTISRLKDHLKGHKNEKSYLCNVCGKNFNFSISLTYHLRLHAEKKCVCNICGLKFTMPNSLKRHLKTHTKDRPYPCDYCTKRFPSRGEKVAHEMTHTGFRPYHCEYCGKGFIKSSNLKTHYLSHEGPHQCNYCPKTFIDMKFLKIHVARAHQDYELLEILEN